MRVRAPLAFTVLLAMATLTAGCAQPGTSADAEPQAPSTAAPLGSADRRVAVYAAVLRQHLTSDDASYRGAVYVLDRAELDAGDPMAGAGAGSGEPIPVEVQDGLVAALADVGPITFVATREEVLQTVDGCPQIRGQGILVTLAPVGAGDRVEIGVSGFAACLDGTWLTYVVERAGAGWVVRGTTGVWAIA